MAQLAKYPTLGFWSGHNITVHEFKPCNVSMEPTWDSLSLSLSLSLSPSLYAPPSPVLHALSLSLFLFLSK